MTRPVSSIPIPGVVWLVVLAVAVAVYWPGLSGPLVLDDFENVWDPLRRLDSGRAAVPDVVLGNESGSFGRALPMATFVLDWLASGLDASRLKYTNLMLHLLAGSLGFWLLGRLLRGAEAGERERAWWVALWCASAWLLSPLLASTVLYVVQRMAQLAAVFVLAGLLAYVIGRQRLAAGRPSGLAGLVLAFLVFWPLAVLSKENGALLPLLALVLEAGFFRFQGPEWVRRLVVGVFVVTVALPALGMVYWLVTSPGYVTGGYGHRDFSLYERLLTQPRVLADYAMQLLLPRGARMGVYHDDFPVSTGWLDPTGTLVAAALWAAGLLAVALAWRHPMGRMIAAAMLFFLAGHLLESTVFPLEIYFEHRNYLPAWGLFLAAGLTILSVARAAPRLRRAVVTGAVALPLVYAVGAHGRAQTWSDWPTMLLSAHEGHPQSARIRSELAAFYARGGEMEAALQELDALVELRPRAAAGAAVQALWLHCVTHTVPAEERYAGLDRSLDFQRPTYLLATYKALLESVLGGECASIDVDRIASAVQTWLTRDGGGSADVRWMMQVYTAKILAYQRRFPETFILLEQAWEALPARAEAGLLAFQYRMHVGDHRAARQALARLQGHGDYGRVDVRQSLVEFEQELASLEARPRE
jgi:hypothetical protein